MDEIDCRLDPYLPPIETEEEKQVAKWRKEFELHLIENKPNYFQEAKQLGPQIQELYENWESKNDDEQFRIIYLWGTGTSCLNAIHLLGLKNELTQEDKEQFIAIILHLKTYIPLLQEMELAVPEYLWKTEEYFKETFERAARYHSETPFSD